MVRPTVSKKKFETKTDVSPEVKISGPSPVEWKPSPDMGKITPPAESEKVCACLHKGADHYGGPRGWCNTGGCTCQEFN